MTRHRRNIIESFRSFGFPFRFWYVVVWPRVDAVSIPISWHVSYCESWRPMDR